MKQLITIGVILIVITFINNDVVLGASQTNSPGTVANVGGIFTDWSNPSYAVSSNDQRASTDPPCETSDALRASNFGFDLPAGSTIDGIVVAVEKRSVNEWHTDSEVYLYNGSTVLGDDKADTTTHWSSSDTVISYGGATDKWSVTPSEVMVESSAFGFQISAEDVVCDGGAAEIDHISMTVYYTESGGESSCDCPVGAADWYPGGCTITSDCAMGGGNIYLNGTVTINSTVSGYRDIIGQTGNVLNLLGAGKMIG